MNSFNPKCCGLDATFVTITPSLSYWYCRECKKEVNDRLEQSQQDSNQPSDHKADSPEFVKELRIADGSGKEVCEPKTGQYVRQAPVVSLMIANEDIKCGDLVTLEYTNVGTYIRKARKDDYK